MKSVFITGANRGLGYGFVQYLLSKDYKVFAGSRKITDKLPQHEDLFWIQCDVTDDKSLDAAILEIKKHTDSLTVLINNAGTNKDTIPEGNKDLVSKMGCLDRSALMNMFELNTVSPIIVTQKFLPLLTEDHCFIINISSSRASFFDGHAGSTANYGYAATKLALNMLTFCSEGELPKNVKTFAVNPGGVKTDMNPVGRTDPLKKAEQIIHIIDNWNNKYHGKFLDYDGILYPL